MAVPPRPSAVLENECGGAGINAWAAPPDGPHARQASGSIRVPQTTRGRRHTLRDSDADQVGKLLPVVDRIAEQ